MHTLKLDSDHFLGHSSQRLVSGHASVAITRYDEYARQPWHTHANPTFFLLLNGEHRDESSATTHDQIPLAICFHPTYAPHRSLTGSKGMVGINIELTPQWMASNNLIEAEFGELLHLQSGAIRFEAIRFAARAFGPRRGECDLDNAVLELVEPFVKSSCPEESGQPNWLHQAHDVIQDGFRDSVSLSAVAKAVAVHPVHLARTYRRFYGFSVTDAINRARLTEACKLMLEGMNAGQAAVEVGYSDQFYLTRVLTKKAGLRPCDVMQLCRKLSA